MSKKRKAVPSPNSQFGDWDFNPETTYVIWLDPGQVIVPDIDNDDPDVLARQGEPPPPRERG